MAGRTVGEGRGVKNRWRDGRASVTYSSSTTRNIARGAPREGGELDLSPGGGRQRVVGQALRLFYMGVLCEGEDK